MRKFEIIKTETVAEEKTTWALDCFNEAQPSKDYDARITKSYVRAESLTALMAELEKNISPIEKAFSKVKRTENTIFAMFTQITATEI
ncbi:MAG: hypothetical protein AB7F25_06975 [Deferribacterales bacterium]